MGITDEKKIPPTTPTSLISLTSPQKQGENTVLEPEMKESAV